MIKAVFLDLDDTLVVNQVLYDHAKERLAGYLRHFGVTGEEVNRAFDSIDREMHKIHGITRHRFPATFEAVLVHFTQAPDAEALGIVRAFADQVFATNAPLNPGVPEALALLSLRHDLYIVTEGDRQVQEKRIAEFPLIAQVKEAFIVDRKSAETYSALAARLGYAPGEVVMIGNSLRSDVVPAVAGGLHGILVEAPPSTSGFRPSYDGQNSLPPLRACQFSSLLEAARHLHENGGVLKAPVFALPAPQPPVPAPKL